MTDLNVPSKPAAVELTLADFPKTVGSVFHDVNNHGECSCLVSMSSDADATKAKYEEYAEQIEAGIPVELDAGYSWAAVNIQRIANIAKDHPVGVVNDKIIEALRKHGVKVYTSRADSKQVLQYQAGGVFTRPMGNGGITKAFTQMIRDHFPALIAKGNYTNAVANATVILSGLAEMFEGVKFNPDSNVVIDFDRDWNAVTASYLQYFNEFDIANAPSMGGAVLDKVSTEDDKLLGGVLFAAFDAIIEKMAQDSAIDDDVDAVRTQLRQVFGRLLDSKHRRSLVMMIIVSPDKGVGKSLFQTLLGNAMGYAIEADMGKLVSGDFDIDWDACRLLQFDELKIAIEHLDRVKKVVTRNSASKNKKYGDLSIATAHYSCVGTTNEVGDVAIGEEERRLDGVNFDKNYTPQYPKNVTPEFEVTSAQLQAFLPYYGGSVRRLIKLDNGNTLLSLNMIGDLIETQINAQPRLYQFAKLVQDAGWFNAERGDLADYGNVEGRVKTRASVEIQASVNAAKFATGKRLLERCRKDGALDYIPLLPIMKQYNITLTENLEEFLDEYFEIDGFNYSLSFANDQKAPVMKREDFDGDVDLPAEFQSIETPQELAAKLSPRAMGEAMRNEALDQLSIALGDSFPMSYVEFDNMLESITGVHGVPVMHMTNRAGEQWVRKQIKNVDCNYKFDNITTDGCTVSVK